MAELTLDAAFRDLRSEGPNWRRAAARSLAPALREEAGHEGLEGVQLHPRYSDACQALREACEDPDPSVRGSATVGLAELRATEALDQASLRLEEEQSFARQSGVMALGELAQGWARGEQCGLSEAQGARLETHLRTLGEDAAPELRFQAASALASIAQSKPERRLELEAWLAQALRNEEEAEVRGEIANLLFEFDPPDASSVPALLEALQQDEESSWWAALSLAALHRTEGLSVLLDAIGTIREGEALEAIALIGPQLDPDTRTQCATRMEGLVARWWTGGTRRVRAAYALARLDPPRGEAQLMRLDKSWSPTTREAVAQARANLATLSKS